MLFSCSWEWQLGVGKRFQEMFCCNIWVLKDVGFVFASLLLWHYDKKFHYDIPAVQCKNLHHSSHYMRLDFQGWILSRYSSGYSSSLVECHTGSRLGESNFLESSAMTGKALPHGEKCGNPLPLEAPCSRPWGNRKQKKKGVSMGCLAIRHRRHRRSCRRTHGAGAKEDEMWETRLREFVYDRIAPFLSRPGLQSIRQT
jgi:hypothetical protein